VTLRYEHLQGIPYSLERDCYELGRDFFRDNFGIELTPYARPQDWSSDNHDLIRQLHEREGFQMLTDWKIADIRPADVFCLAIGQGNPNHFAIYLGDNKLLHHLRGRFSSVEVYRDVYRNSTSFILRHPDVPDLRPVLPDTTIASLLNDRYQPRTA
jgi:cell wall-associated NlpC family hydrolase